MIKSVVWLTRVDRLCGRLNSGLTAVVVALTIVLALQLTVRAAVALNDELSLDTPINEMLLAN